MVSAGALVGALCAALVGLVVLSGDAARSRVNVVTMSGVLEKHLRKIKDLAGGDYEGYRGHCYRVLNYALILLEQDETRRGEIEAALAFHDAGLWTDGALS
jgi:hypothetical protein